MSTPTGPDFDCLRLSRRLPPVSHVTPLDYPTRNTRPVLKSVPGEHDNRTEQVSPRPLKSVPKASDSTPDNLHHLLTSGSEECTLAPLHLRRRSSSPPASDSSTPELQRHGTVLPSLKSVTSGISAERLASSVGDIEINSQADEDEENGSTNDESTADELDVKEEQRQEHARLIKDLLIYINFEYKKRHGVPGGNKDRRVGSRALVGPGVPGIQRPLSSMDVEMTVV